MSGNPLPFTQTNPSSHLTKNPPHLLPKPVSGIYKIEDGGGWRGLHALFDVLLPGKNVLLPGSRLIRWLSLSLFSTRSHTPCMPPMPHLCPTWDSSMPFVCHLNMLHDCLPVPKKIDLKVTCIKDPFHCQATKQRQGGPLGCLMCWLVSPGPWHTLASAPRMYGGLTSMEVRSG